MITYIFLVLYLWQKSQKCQFFSSLMIRGFFWYNNDDIHIYIWLNAVSFFSFFSWGHPAHCSESVQKVAGKLNCGFFFTHEKTTQNNFPPHSLEKRLVYFLLSFFNSLRSSVCVWCNYIKSTYIVIVSVEAFSIEIRNSKSSHNTFSHSVI